MEKTILVLFVAMVMTMPIVQSEVDLTKEVGSWYYKNFAMPKTTRFRFYLHDIYSGKNVSAYTIARASITNQSTTFFGLVNLMDDLLTEGPEPTSKLIGRAQGLYAGVGLEKLSVIMDMSLYFTTGKYNGSTLTVVGRNPATELYREMPIIGGTGRFRLARGTVISKTYSFDAATLNAVVQYDVTVLHY